MPVMTMADHAEAWWREQGKEVPSRDTDEWRRMYETWVAWAFADLHDQEKPRRRAQSTST
jgi:hypothetical protein